MIPSEDNDPWVGRPGNAVFRNTADNGEGCIVCRSRTEPSRHCNAERADHWGLCAAIGALT